MTQTVLRSIAVLGAMLAVVACGVDGPTVPDDTSPLAGLSKSAPGDTSNSTNAPTGTGPGYFTGTVLGPSQPGAGNDSLNTAPRISGVVVTIYERKQSGGADTVAVGNAKGTVTTGADGKFTLPTLPAGEYVVTFVPPSSSGYHGAYAFGPLRENSHQYPWWVVLAKK
jgi:hypothetical protein